MRYSRDVPNSSVAHARSTDELYSERLTRYVTAMRNGMPDRVPVRPFAAEFTAKYAGFDCQQVTHDYRVAFDAVLHCCSHFPWDAVVPNMVYVWTGLTQALDLKYYGIPGVDIAPDVAFQYREPAEADAFMKREEYDELIDNPVRFLYETWLPRVSGEVAGGGYRRDVALVKGGMSMLSYFMAFGGQLERMRSECGTPSSICGMLKAPLDILADKLRGYIGLAFDLMECPDKVLKACEALMPHLARIALDSADPSGQLPIPIWMHRGCVPFISREHFDRIYWPTLRPMVEALWAKGNQTLFYAEGKWDAHLATFAELPAGSIVYHLDRTDPAEAHRVLGRKFCLSGGVPNALLAFGKPEEVRAKVRWLIENMGADGGYIVDASAIMQNDAAIENVRAMTDAAIEFGAYRSPSSAATPVRITSGAPEWVANSVCNAYVDRPIPGNSEIVRRIWDENESLAYLFIWHVLLSF